MKRSVIASSVLSILLPAILAACGGGAATDSTTSGSTGTTGTTGSTAAPKPLVVPANFTISGSVGSDKHYGGAVVTAYDAAGKVCTTARGDDTTGAFTLGSKCLFPIVLSADLPDGNDILPLADGVKGEGRQWHASVPEIMKDGASFTVDVTPLSTAATSLALGRLPVSGLPNSGKVLTAARLADAYTKIGEALQQFMTATGATTADLATAPSEGSPMGRLLQIVRVQTIRIDSSKQTNIKFQSATEHRPIVLSLADGSPVTSTIVDSGLGMKLEDVSQAELQAGLSLLPEIQAAATAFVASPAGQIDGCFMHNGRFTSDAIYDLPPGWTLGTSKIENPRILRINTYTNMVNETLEERNSGGAKLVFMSFDFRDMRGLKRRSYSWLIKGDQALPNGCSSTGSTWRVLGNQRVVYLRSWTYALHDVSFGNQFSARKDLVGVGTEHFVGGSDGPAGNFTHVLVSGPGIPDDGKVFVRVDDTYLYCTMPLKQVRVQGNLYDSATSPEGRNDALLPIFIQVQDTKSVLMTDVDIKKEITDSFFDETNTYTYRFFTNYSDLAPSLTLQDILPKRPYLSSEVPIAYFPSIGINMDNLVRGLQSPEDIVVNWNLPLDLRAKRMTPYNSFLQRISCMSSKLWPKCTQRGQYIAEYGIDTQYPLDETAQSVVHKPTPTPTMSNGDPTYMRQAKSRVKILDSYGRQLETAWSMDYQR